eukprot:GILJ01006802.1.p2 GENE.GILJ01006802.1~~GILJ01006802.1.p2  ORF type:complete len:128 (+),score=14.20 GILJ01006802.1:280-663(+)
MTNPTVSPNLQRSNFDALKSSLNRNTTDLDGSCLMSKEILVLPLPATKKGRFTIKTVFSKPVIVAVKNTDTKTDIEKKIEQLIGVPPQAQNDVVNWCQLLQEAPWLEHPSQQPYRRFDAHMPSQLMA